jgi:hypothetical protein
MFKTPRVKILQREKQEIMLRCSSDRVALAAEAESFREASSWFNLIWAGAAFVGPKLPVWAPTLVGLLAARSTGGVSSLVRFGKFGLIGYKIIKRGIQIWSAWKARRTGLPFARSAR